MQTITYPQTTLDVFNVEDTQATPVNAIVDTTDKIVFVNTTITKVADTITVTPNYTEKQIAVATLPDVVYPVIGSYDGAVYSNQHHWISLNDSATNTALTVAGGIPNPTTACYPAPTGFKWVAYVSATMNVFKQWTGIPAQPVPFGVYTYIKVGTSAGRTESRQQVPIKTRETSCELNYSDIFDIAQNATSQMFFYVELYTDSSATVATFETWATSFNIENISYRVHYKLIKT